MSETVPDGWHIEWQLGYEEGAEPRPWTAVNVPSLVRDRPWQDRYTWIGTIEGENRTLHSLSVCHECGAAVQVIAQHDRWHQKVKRGAA